MGRGVALSDVAICPEGFYRFGFNGQEMDNEISGQTGTHTTAMFWEYDARLGRRWNIDPVVKSDRSGYTCFGNNPIIFVDPEGNTDYYNNKGKWIGSDGVDNGEKFMAIEKSTAKEIKMEMKKNEVVAMKPNDYKDIVQIPDNETLKNMSDAWNTGTSIDNNEYAIAVGKVKGKEESIVKKGTPGSNPTGKVLQIMSQNGKVLYSIHTHDTEIEDKGVDVSISSSNPSYKDIKLSAKYESDYNINQGGYQSISIGVDITNLVRNSDKSLSYDTEVMISFYTSSSTTQRYPSNGLNDNSQMVPNAKMNFNSYLKASTRANKDFAKRHKN
ncbi:hypothetical protein DSECCO2_611110 [anaerobic digester metagenome]